MKLKPIIFYLSQINWQSHKTERVSLCQKEKNPRKKA